MSQDNDARLQFAEFLTRLANGRDQSTEWSEYVATHYSDPFLEEIRRCVMRLRHYSTAVWGDQASSDTLLSWADALRLSIDSPLQPHNHSYISLRMTASEFVMLDCMLRRFSETDEFMIKDNAERQALYNLQCLCESYPAHSELPAISIAREELLGQ